MSSIMSGTTSIMCIFIFLLLSPLFTCTNSSPIPNGITTYTRSEPLDLRPGTTPMKPDDYTDFLREVKPPKCRERGGLQSSMRRPEELKDDFMDPLQDNDSPCTGIGDREEMATPQSKPVELEDDFMDPAQDINSHCSGIGDGEEMATPLSKHVSRCFQNLPKPVEVGESSTGIESQKPSHVLRQEEQPENRSGVYVPSGASTFPFGIWKDRQPKNISKSEPRSKVRKDELQRRMLWCR